MIPVAIVLILGFSAELFFLPGIGWIKYLMAIMVAASAILLLTEKEDPVEPGKFWFDVLLGLIPCISMLFLYEHAKYMIH